MRNIHLALGLMVITKNFGVRHKKCLHGEREKRPYKLDMRRILYVNNYKNGNDIKPLGFQIAPMCSLAKICKHFLSPTSDFSPL